MKKIISFGLWGENTRYTIGALKNADLAKEIYPDWICRYYVGKSTPIEIIKSLYEKDNTEIIIMNEQGDWNGMFWRFFPASDSDVEVMISRDSDSRLSQREKAAVDEWLDSDKGFHIMRDHPAHGTEILGGMWGAKLGSIPQMKTLILEYSKDNSYVHDEFFEKKPFPTIRKDGIDKNGNPTDFIGEPVNENDERIW